MRKILISFLCMTLTGGLLFAQKTITDPTAEKRNASGFHAIEVSTGIELMLTQGNSEQVAVSAATNEFRDRIVTKVENGVLKIYYDSKMGSVNKKKEDKDLKAYVSYNMLDMLDANTGAEVKIEGVLKASSLNLKANTGAVVNGEISVTNLKISQNTGSRVSLSGKAEKLEIEGSTGSRFKGEDMSTTNCDINVSTGATVSVQADKEIQVRANTGGSVRYKGNATVREFKTHTGGSVQKI